MSTDVLLDMSGIPVWGRNYIKKLEKENAELKEQLKQALTALNSKAAQKHE